MANGRNKLRRSDAGRDAGGFVALPWVVLDSPAFARLSMHARALLLEVARQFVRDNNGRLLLTRKRMAARGWKSNDMLTNARRELEAAGFIYQTVKGRRPNRASWFAVTWASLDAHPDFDPEALANFTRSAYKNASLRPPHGVESTAIAPPHGVERPATAPPHGAMRGTFQGPPTPPHGHHLDNHLPASASRDVQDVQGMHGVTLKPAQSSSASTTPRPPRARRCRTDEARPAPQPPDPSAQLELMLPMDGVMD